jgi:hypothetical protein
LRELFGIPKQPSSATFEGWDEYTKTSKDVSKFGCWLVEFLDVIQDIFMYVPDKIKSTAYYFSNIKNKSHVLRTNTKRGQWSDLTSRIPDALMLAVIDFVEKECFWMNIMGTTGDSDVAKYARQSYITRKLFPIYIDTETRAKHGFEWLDFQINSMEPTKRKIERHPYQKIKAAYLFAVGRYKTFDVYDEVGYDLLTTEPFSQMTPEKREMCDKMRVLEAEHEKEITKHCANIVKYREYLWT